jgi:hypothetical protein
MTYCLNSIEVEKLLLLHLDNKKIENESLNMLVDSASQWEEKFLCLTFSFARILEKHGDSMPLIQAMIKELFSLHEKMFIEIEECGEDFIEYMLGHEHSGENDLEVSLQTVAIKLSEYCYGKNTLRY